MKCPYCGSLDNKVTDSRLKNSGSSIRRRRQCLSCKRRFTTFEYVEEMPLMVIKKDGRREPFDRKKLLAGVLKACEKRPVGMDRLEEIVDIIERTLNQNFEQEVPSSDIGELVMKYLYELDEVAYVRFASVYRQFKDINQFMKELKGLLNTKAK
ncbi:MAG: transcriptional repressor NrdR [Candidatus Omnitrophica bacterium]|nr:transcriptional repressor NrdR [Candidatus Omnitrophota bacterium]